MLQDVAGGIAQRKTVHEYVDGRSILAPQNFFVIVDFPLALEPLREFLPPFGRKIDLGGNVELQDSSRLL